MESLANFKKFNPSMFSGEGGDPMIVEPWVDSMEHLFENLRISDRDQVTLALPFLHKMAHRLSKAEKSKRDQATLPLLTWEEF